MIDFIIGLLYAIAFICWGGYQYERGKQKVYGEWNKWLNEVFNRWINAAEKIANEKKEGK